MKKLKANIITTLCSFLIALPLSSVSDEAAWQQTIELADGKTVYFNAWGGSEVINDYIEWAVDRVREDYNIIVKHVKINDTANVVNRVLAEKTAGKNKDGSIDLIWINGENFKRMKENALLLAPWTDRLPNYEYTDFESPLYQFDFTIPVNNQELPWGKAQLSFIHDSNRLKTPPYSMKEFANVAKNNPNKLTYPAPPAFIGTTFLKQALIELIEDKALLSKAAPKKQEFAKATAPLWKFLDELHPNLWNKGKRFPAASEMLRMLGDSELLISMTFNPNEASNAVDNGDLPRSVRSYIHEGGTIGNVHFLAIPYNSTSPEAAKVFANFLLSFEAQIRKANINIWGDPTVLSLRKIKRSHKRMFQKLPKGQANLSEEDLANVLPEPHPSWVSALEKEWQKRYSK